MPVHLPPAHPQIPASRIGVLLINLGTPEAPTPAAVRTYLAEFLSDRRVVEVPRPIWWLILHGIILPFRARRSAHAYAQIWTERGSPLAAITADQAAAVQQILGPVTQSGLQVDWAMRYGRPAIADRIRALKAQGCDRILIAPLYPQYCAATTATALDATFGALMAMRWQPALRTLPPYHDDPAYIRALADHARRHLNALDFVPERLVVSFHSMPARTLDRGDPYHCHCQKTARLLGEALGQPLEISFQSRLGRAKWLEPSTENTLSRLAAEGVKRLAVITPGFAADNLETLEEIAIRGRQTFLDGGGTEFAALPCLNDSSEGIAMLGELLARHLAGWVAHN